jgi:beta-lysine 5,6-aminomutase beta subunit
MNRDGPASGEGRSRDATASGEGRSPEITQPRGAVRPSRPRDATASNLSGARSAAGGSGGSSPRASTVIRPYGDTTGDGRVQVSFTLPVPFGGETERARAEGAALQLAAKMGLDPAMVVHAKGIGPDFTFFIVYGRVSHLVDISAVTVAEREFPLLSAQEVNLRIRSALGRKFVVVGACIGTDAHTVGIDAILNVKGHAGEKGLEYYREIRVVNMGAQVDVPDLVARARAERADAVLVSQVVTQRDAHLSNAREMSAAFRGAYPGGGRPVLVVGGPRFDPAAAGALGVDAIFGRGTTPREVASYLAATLGPGPAHA